MPARELRFPPLDLQALRPLVGKQLRWDAWARCIRRNGFTIDRPEGSTHPEHRSVRYPLDYGFVNDTLSTDDAPVDMFVGRGTTGLVGIILTTDHRQQDREGKFLYDCTPADVYMAHGFINYDRTLLEGVLVLRHPLERLWEHTKSVGTDPSRNPGVG